MTFTWWGFVVFFILIWAIFRSFLFAAAATAFMIWWDPVWNADVGGWFGDVWLWCAGVIDSVWSFIKEHPKFFIWWYVIGIIGALAWPYKYRRNIGYGTRVRLIATTPFMALTGPFAFILSYPM